MSDRPQVDSRVAAMRDAFDRAFALPPPDPAVSSVDLLAVRVGGRPYVLWMTDLTAVHPALAVTPVPTSASAFCGLAQIDARLVPVYDLCLLLGHESPGPPGCFVITAREQVALAIDAFERHVRVPRDRVVVQDGAAGDHASGTAMVEVDGIPRPLVSLPTVLDAVRTRAAAADGMKDTL